VSLITLTSEGELRLLKAFGALGDDRHRLVEAMTAVDSTAFNFSSRRGEFHGRRHGHAPSTAAKEVEAR
jgi:hypothetical protein